MARPPPSPAPAAALLALAALASVGPAALPAQSLTAVPDSARVTVGDPVEVRVLARLPEGAVAEGAAPVPADSLPEGVRVLSTGGWRRVPGGALEARLRLAFFRPGERAVPPLALPYRPAPGAPLDTLLSGAAPVRVVPVLPPGEQTLRDIKDLEPLPGAPFPWPLALLALVAALAAWLLVRRLRRRAAAVSPAVAAPSRAPLPPYEAALERLAALEHERLPERGGVAEHYERAADVLRRYLEEAEEVPAPELTTSELAWALPPDLAAGGLRDRCRELLEEADLVKFARVRPEPARARGFVDAARGLLAGWHAAARSRAPAAPAPGAEPASGAEPAARSAGA